MNCEGITLKGNKCRNRVKNGTYCRHHQKLIITTSNEDSECPVCYDVKQQKNFVCGHSMCFDCYSLWIKKNPSCPICRHRFSDVQSESSITNETYIDEILYDEIISNFIYLIDALV